MQTKEQICLSKWQKWGGPTVWSRNEHTFRVSGVIWIENSFRYFYLEQQNQKKRKEKKDFLEAKENPEKLKPKNGGMK